MRRAGLVTAPRSGGDNQATLRLRSALPGTGLAAPEPGSGPDRGREAEADRLAAPLLGRMPGDGWRAMLAGRPDERLWGGLRFHTGRAAQEAAAALGARAVACGDDILFGDGGFDPASARGRYLIAHEAAHAAQQRRDGIRRIDRYPLPGGPRAGESLVANAPFVAGEIRVEPGDPLRAVSDAADGFVQVELPLPYVHAFEPFLIPTAYVDPAAGTPPGAGAVIPGGAFHPVDVGPADLMPNLAEGVPVEVDIADLPPELLAAVGQEEGGDFTLRGWMVSQAGRAVGAATDRHLLSYGFHAAADNAVGLVGYPRWPSLRALGNLELPQSPILFGHTIAYARVEVRIVAMTSFAPGRMVAAGWDAISGAHAGVPGQLVQHLDPQDFPLSISGTHGFPNTSSLSIEWPVTPGAARQLAGRMSGEEAHAMLRYAAYMERCAGAQNCVAWAVTRLEEALGGEIGQAGQPPLHHQGGVGRNRQGRFQALAEAALEHQRSGGARGAAVSDLPNAQGAPVASRMPVRMRILKWGGRLFEIGGVAYGAYRISEASEAERPIVIADEAAGLVAGPAWLPVSELYVRPIQDLARGEGDATLLILPHPYLLPLVRILEPEKQDPEGSRMIRRAVLGDDPGAIEYVLRRMFGVPW